MKGLGEWRGQTGEIATSSLEVLFIVGYEDKTGIKRISVIFYVGPMITHII